MPLFTTGGITNCGIPFTEVKENKLPVKTNF
jgi:hypothetical protein